MGQATWSSLSKSCAHYFHMTPGLNECIARRLILNCNRTCCPIDLLKDSTSKLRSNGAFSFGSTSALASALHGERFARAWLVAAALFASTSQHAYEFRTNEGPRFSGSRVPVCHERVRSLHPQGREPFRRMLVCRAFSTCVEGLRRSRCSIYFHLRSSDP